MNPPISLGDLVGFQLTTGQACEGVVIHKIVEKRQPTIYLIECADQRRSFRFENEIVLIAPADDRETAARKGLRFDAAHSVPMFAATGADD